LKVLVGLGNPGAKYENTRHNAGFLMLDKIAEKFGIAISSSKFDAVIGRGQVFGEDSVLVKPMTFMNRSGISVGQVVRFFKTDVKNVVVLHDDVDVPSGKVRARLGGGHGGHNGIRSIIEEAGLADFHRIKLGIGKPEHSVKENGVVNWVLGNFTEAELSLLNTEMFDEVLVRLKNVY
jgi:PTH1 family peptidyl-tRNA hydrolase